MKSSVLFFCLISFIPSVCLAMDHPLDLIDVESEGLPVFLVMDSPEVPIDVESEDVPSPSRKRKRSDNDLHTAFDKYAKTRDWGQHSYVMPHYGDLLEKDEEKDPSATQPLLDTRGETFCFTETSDRNIYQTNIDQNPEYSGKTKSFSTTEEFADSDDPTQDCFSDTEDTEDLTQEELVVATAANNIGQVSAPQNDLVSQPSQGTLVLQPSQRETASKKPILRHGSRSTNAPSKDGV